MIKVTHEVAVFAEDAAFDCFVLRTRMAARAVTRAYNSRLRSLNLLASQFALLIAVKKGGSAPIAALAERLDMEPSTLQRNLKLLEARGLVAGDGGRGRKGRRLQLTPTGQALLAKAAPVWAEAQAAMTGALGEEVETVRMALGRIETAALQMEGKRRTT